MMPDMEVGVSILVLTTTLPLLEIEPWVCGTASSEKLGMKSLKYVQTPRKERNSAVLRGTPMLMRP